jgi:NADPH:quinone reductase-like Zn-dependent oxidoreductase
VVDKDRRMKAIVWTKYGPPDVLQLREVEKPSPKRNEVLIKIHATTVTSGDCEQRSLTLPFWFRLTMRAFVGLKKPERITILGMELAGEIELIGEDVKLFEVGDQVFGATGFANMGTYAEYICLPEASDDGALSKKPAKLSFEDAATVPVGGVEALSFLRQGNLQSGDRILINGAGGTIGPFAVQLAKYFGAEVTGVDSRGKLDMLRSIGADFVIDYTEQDFTDSGETYDLILDLVGKSSFSRCINSLNQNGCYLIANPGLTQMIRGRWTSRTGSKKVVFGASYPNPEDLIFLGNLIELGTIKTVIDRTYQLVQIPEAHRYVETGQKVGNVVITIA